MWLAAREIACNVPIVLCPIRIAHQGGDIAAEHLRVGVTEQAFGTAIERPDEAPVVDEHYAVYGCIEDGLQGLADDLFGGHAISPCGPTNRFKSAEVPARVP
jgi:hypothetical protein